MKNNITNMTFRVQLYLTSGLIIVFILISPNIMGRNVNVSDFGAVGDASTLNTKALQEAINTCTQTGGGEVIVPPRNLSYRHYFFT